MMDRFATWVFTKVTGRKWGHCADIMQFIVKDLGPFGALRWLLANLPTYERSIVEMGVVRSHLAFTVASLLNGCAYCTYANGRAFELHYFEQLGRLFPLDEYAIVALADLPDGDLREKLVAALTEAGLAEDIAMCDRIFALKLEGATPRPEDRYLVHAIRMFDMLNKCAVEWQVGIDDAHHDVNREVGLKARYAEARLAEGERRKADG
jgi:hypothetical protein